MNEHFKEADKLIREIIPSLQKILNNDGEDISYYNPSILDLHIMNLIKARVAMSIGREIDPVGQAINNLPIKYREKEKTMKFSDLNDKQKEELFILNPEWFAYNRPKWMVENHLYYMLTHYSHIIDGLMSSAIVDNRIDSVVKIPDDIANKLFNSTPKEREYQKYEFCKAVECTAMMSVCTYYGCIHTAKDFHHWLKENSFVIKKKL